MQSIILDANVVIKTLIDEPDSQTALDCIETCLSNNCLFKAPSLFQYEIAGVCFRQGVSTEEYSDFMEGTIDTLITQSSPKREAWKSAGSIMRKGNQKSGFPSVYDSIYHAMAIVEKGTFVTADHRHYEKSKAFGHIVILEDWETIFDGQKKE